MTNQNYITEYAKQIQETCVNKFFAELDRSIKQSKEWGLKSTSITIPTEYSSYIFEEITKRGYIILNKPDINLLWPGRRLVQIAVN